MSDVDLLREAARLMRERAEAATPGSWLVSGAWNKGVRIGDDPFLALMPNHWGKARPENAEHIVSWHPAVALAVADWLEQAADQPTLVMFSEPEFDEGALAVATTYLGGPVTPAAAPDPAASRSGAAGSTQPPVRPAAEEDTGRTGHHTQRPSCS